MKAACAIAFAVFGVLGAAVGSTVGKMVDGQYLLTLFGVAMIAIGASIARKPAEVGNAKVRLDWQSAPRLLPWIAPTALGVGFMAGFFGIGGGFLIVPGLIFATGMPLLNAVGSSLMSVTAFGLTTAGNYALSGLVDWRIAAFLLLGGVGGGMAGVRLARHLASRQPALSYAFAASSSWSASTLSGGAWSRSFDGLQADRSGWRCRGRACAAPPSLAPVITRSTTSTQFA